MSGSDGWQCGAGLGDIGPEAGILMEGKCALFKAFGGADAFPLCIKTQDVDVIVDTITIFCSFAGLISRILQRHAV